MRLKISKNELISKLSNAVYPYPQPIPDIAHLTPQNLKYEIERYARDAAKQAALDVAEIFLENVYTEEEFESDLGLDR